MSDHPHAGHQIIESHFDRLRLQRETYRSHRNALLETLELAMSALDDLIADGRALKAERADLLVDRDAQKARADKAEADRDALQKQIDDDEKKAADAAAELKAEIDAEAPSATVVVAAPVTAPAMVIPVAPGTVDASDVGSAVSGPGIADGTTVAPGTTDGSLVLDQPTTSDHVGDGTETLTVTPAA